jgi:hypothetical protein
MSYNMMIGYDIYDHFTMEHFRLRQSMILTSFFLLATVVYMIFFFKQYICFCAIFLCSTKFCSIVQMKFVVE